MSKKIIIHIDGLQGSGKSYICSKLNDIVCIDTDDIRKKAIQIIEDSQKTSKRIPRTWHQFDKIKSQIVNKYIETYDKIVFVGMTAVILNPTYKIFIKITDFTEVYKRLLLRELDKILVSSKEIKQHIREENDPNEIDVQLIADMSLRFPVDYESFLEHYKDRLSEAKKNKYVVKTQEEIIDFINKL